MNIFSRTVIAITTVIISCNSLSATLITKQDLNRSYNDYEKIGVVSTNGDETSPMDTRDVLSKLADEKGGDYYIIISSQEHGRFSAVADVYKDKNPLPHTTERK
ncbi:MULTISPECIES: YdgH/BhsA/McbA-like domain containing protein [Enterobacterales]|uniref:YdgH/BhsA/McbA-like domain containing protein n=1 Tax=Enterobacterales TaxID=91347 RepID=UPI000F7E5E04|nr:MULTISPECIES: YdgH/BhsA/McbA-like domain containing protein [Enterobacterales]RSV89060.1 DUF1471 domain-containing protein [Klebsiella aerogenes]